MSGSLEELRNFIGSYIGMGKNHENEKFVGKFELTEALGGKGFQIYFSAHAEGNSHTVFHSEISTIAPSLTGGISLFNLNTNLAFLAEHHLTASNSRAAGREFVFRFGDLENTKSFREEIRLELLHNNQIGYHYSWGMPGGDFADRSGAVMQRKS